MFTDLSSLVICIIQGERSISNIGKINLFLLCCPPPSFGRKKIHKWTYWLVCISLMYKHIFCGPFCHHRETDIIYQQLLNYCSHSTLILLSAGLFLSHFPTSLSQQLLCSRLFPFFNLLFQLWPMTDSF